MSRTWLMVASGGRCSDSKDQQDGLDSWDHPHCASQTLMASTVRATSWTRTTSAPATRAARAEATEAAVTLADRAAGQRAEETLARRADQQGTTQARKTIEVPQEIQVVGHRLAEADAGVDGDARMRDAVRLGAGRSGGRGSRGPRSRRRRSAGFAAWCAGCPSCASARARRPASATTRAISGSPSRAVMSLRIDGPGGERGPGDGRLGRVHRDRHGDDFRPGPRPSARPGAAPRRRGRARTPGRLDSPPMSSRSAPSSTSRRACAAASSEPGVRPPSEKLSGVTLTMPMTRGRPSPARATVAELPGVHRDRRASASASRAGLHQGSSIMLTMSRASRLHDLIVPELGRLAEFGEERDVLVDRDLGGLDRTLVWPCRCGCRPSGPGLSCRPRICAGQVVRVLDRGVLVRRR